jgi:hypothetical protein
MSYRTPRAIPRDKDAPAGQGESGFSTRLQAGLAGAKLLCGHRFPCRHPFDALAVLGGLACHP